MEVQGYDMLCTNPFTAGVKQTRFGEIGIPCGKCMACRINKTSEWTMRLQHELKYFDDSSFITLTYDDNWLPQGGELIKRDLQLFIKRFRKFIGSRCRIKYYACGEYGDTSLRPHYHLIVLGWKPKTIKYVTYDGTRKIYSSPEISNLWQFGHNTVGVVTHDSIQYVVGYVRKKLDGDKANEVYGKRQRPFALISKGIGERYALEHADKLEEELAIIEKGIRKSMPRYYADKAKVPQIKRIAYALRQSNKSVEDYINNELMTAEDQFRQIDLNLKAKSALRKDKL